MNYLRAYNIDDLRTMAQQVLPRMAWDYLERGAEDDVTMHDNTAALRAIKLRPRVLVDVSDRHQQTNLFGRSYSAPIGVAPTGAAGLYCYEADVVLARAAAAAQLPFVLSTASFTALERVAEAAGGTKWFQLYMSKDHGAAERLILRAGKAGYEALVVTTDVPVGANREYNRRNGFEIPIRLNARNMLDGALHPRWLLGTFFRALLQGGPLRFLNVDATVDGRIVSKDLSAFREQRDSLIWEDIAWLRTIWKGPLFVKGVLTVEDAREAQKAGADGVFVSNHGGRQLDHAVTPLLNLPRIADAVGKSMKIMVDSGFRRGSDIVKALALGADMVFVGRAPLYGAAVGGEAGALRALELLKQETDRIMALIGANRLNELGPEYLHMPEHEVD